MKVVGGGHISETTRIQCACAHEASAYCRTRRSSSGVIVVEEEKEKGRTARAKIGKASRPAKILCNHAANEAFTRVTNHPNIFHISCENQLEQRVMTSFRSGCQASRSLLSSSRPIAVRCSPGWSRVQRRGESTDAQQKVRIADALCL